MNHKKISIAFRLFFLLLYFKLKLHGSDFKSCLKVCESPGFLTALEDHEFADKVLRKLLSWLPFEQGCLLHSLSLAKASRKDLKLYLSFLQQDPLIAHSFVQVEKDVYSTSLHSLQDALPVWSKQC